MQRKLFSTFTLAAGALAVAQFAPVPAQAEGVFIQRQCERFSHFCGGLGNYQAARQFYDALGRPLVSKKPRAYGRFNGTSPVKKRALRKKRRQYN